MPPTCTPEKKNDYQNERVPSESNELYFTTKEFAVQSSGARARVCEDVQINALVQIFPDLDQLFTLHKQVGYGTFSTVYLASLKTDPNKQFAIKHIVPTCHPERIKFELQCLQDIGGIHNVAGVHLCLRNKNDIVLIMPYQPHDFFNDYVGLMDVKELACYMKNLLVALARVHSFGIVHRDIKPSNFLYDRKNKRFMLVDFGLAHSVCVAKEIPDKKRKRDMLSPTIDDLTQPMKKIASSNAPIQILGASQKENDPQNKEKEQITYNQTPKIKQNNTCKSRQSEVILTHSTHGQIRNEYKDAACRCYGKPRTCNFCITKKFLKALRAGTPGFRPPEVLLKSAEQNTGVDIWAAGVIMLSILSNCCNFFSSPDDMTALAEIMTIFGYEEVKKVAGQLGRYLICSENCPPLDLRKICCTLRARDKLSACITNNDACIKCNQPVTFCLCIGTKLNKSIPDEFTVEAYDILSKLLDVNVKTRITANEALKHPFFKDL
ncbi:Protein kinase domain [Popillia japonica]|uniref:non-specific serine/threonine protein kinase n=1 Tax=Popillia japonica TaxID=7064 RepID=A0AAW1IV30_POPJA